MYCFIVDKNFLNLKEMMEKLKDFHKTFKSEK